MTRKKFILLLTCFIVFVFASCKKQYIPAVSSQVNSFLVVSGFINTAENSVSKIVLSHTTNLGDTVLFAPEYDAIAKIESDAGDVYPLTGNGDGTYTSGTLSLDTANKYRLSILRLGNGRYESEFVECKQTPAIDSLNWKQEDGDVTLYVNTHDPSGNTRYYWWDYTETWQYRTPNETVYGLNGNRVFVRTPDEQIRDCWVTGEATDILIGSSSLLSDDVISLQPLLKIVNKDKRLNFRYSMLVKQYGITAQAYQYWKNIKSNSQQLGTLFDQQPSQLKGNITALNDPDEPVIGFVCAARQQEQRIFINHDELASWEFDGFAGYNCGFDFVEQNPDPYLYTYPDPAYVPWYFATGGILYVINKSCVDCTLKGGSNHKPSFW